MEVPGHIFLFIKSRSLKVRCHVPSTVGPGKENFTSTSGSQTLAGQLGHVAAQGSSFISCTTPDKTLGVQLPVTLIAEFPWVVAPGACPGKLFLVYSLSGSVSSFKNYRARGSAPHHLHLLFCRSVYSEKTTYGSQPETGNSTESLVVILLKTVILNELQPQMSTGAQNVGLYYTISLRHIQGLHKNCNASYTDPCHLEIC